jgi:two-component system response regulator GlrR
MNLFNILLAESFGQPCSDDRGHNLKSILETSALGSHLRIHSLCLDRLHTFPYQPDLVILRFGSAPPLAWESLIERLQRWKDVKLIGAFCGNTASRDIAQSLEWGLADYALCPWREADMVPRLERLLPSCPRSQVTPDSDEAPKSRFRIDSLIGESPCLLRQLDQIPLLASSKATVLITGETGTGKDLVARAIHAAGPRPEKPFVSVNCGALPEHLIESELFGHFKGAFTGASETHAGLIAEAEGGTLFLDEIDTANSSVQVKLLQFLQDREYRPIGCTKSRRADVRVIAATNADLRKRVEEKCFREDLFFRLDVLSIHLPTLRERIEDVPILATYFVGKHAERRVIGAPALSPGALQKLMAYAWPGNVRELEGVIHRAVLFAPVLPLQPEAIAIPVSPFGQASQGAFLRNAKAQAIGQFERVYLVNLLATHRGNVSQAAKAAGKERRTFQRLLLKYGLEVGAFRTDIPSETTH